MINHIFPTSYYWIFDIPNFHEIQEYVKLKTKVDNTNFTWGDICKIDRIPLSLEETKSILLPSIELFANKFRDSQNIKIYDPWINLYKENFFQEVHDHKNDIACVMFLNDGEEFAKFFFYNRYNNSVSYKLENIFSDMSHNDVWYPDTSAGKVIFFPGTMLHGVSPHKSDIIRKTLSFNIDIMPL